MKDLSKDLRIEKIYNQLVQYSTGNFALRETVSEAGDELDAIIVGLNTLGEELYSTGRALNEFESRINRVLDVLIRYIQMDFSEKIEVTKAGDELDAIALGLNTLAEELKAARDAEKLNLDRLREQNDLISNLNDSLQDNIQQLEIANRELEAFTYSVSHDLRTPLRAIHSYTKILSEEYLKGVDDEGKEMMASVMRNAKKMGQLIDDLLAFSKVGKKELVITFVDMNHIVASAIKDLHGLHHATIRKASLPPALGDQNLLGLVWTNLITNAIKYSSHKADQQIEIGNHTDKGSVVYYIKDNGAGFDMQYYDKLFGVFHRLHAEHEFEGNGVGLALVHRIITRHGGRIWAEGKVGEGATFYFTLNT